MLANIAIPLHWHHSIAPTLANIVILADVDPICRYWANIAPTLFAGRGMFTIACRLVVGLGLGLGLGLDLVSGC